MPRTLLPALALLGATALPAFAQDAAITEAGGDFAAIPNTFSLFQRNGEGNVLGGAQTSALPDLRFSQTGFYNRGVVVQTGAEPIGVIVQTGSFDRALILQTAGLGLARVDQLGSFNSGFVVQFGNGNGATIVQDGTGAINGAATVQDSTTTLPLTAAETRVLVGNFLYAPETVRAPAEMTELGGIAFVDSLLAHRAERRAVCAGAAAEPRPPSDCERFSLDATLDHANGSQEARLGALGFDHETTGITLGGDLPLTPEFTAGLALRYQRSDADVASGFADVDADSFGGAVTADWQRDGFFATGLGFYLRDSVEISRAGIGGEGTGASPHGDTFGGAVRGGYLFDLGAVEAGPLLGYTQVRSELDGYSEGGNRFLAQVDVGRQRADARIGLVGARLSAARASEGVTMRGTFDIAYERDFESDDFAAQRTGFAFAPAVGVFTPVAALGDQDALSLSGEASLDFAQNLSMGVSAGGRWSDQRKSWRLGAAIRKGF